MSSVRVVLTSKWLNEWELLYTSNGQIKKRNEKKEEKSTMTIFILKTIDYAMQGECRQCALKLHHGWATIIAHREYPFSFSIYSMRPSHNLSLHFMAIKWRSPKWPGCCENCVYNTTQHSRREASKKYNKQKLNACIRCRCSSPTLPFSKYPILLIHKFIRDIEHSSK